MVWGKGDFIVDENESHAIVQVSWHWLLTSSKVVHVGFVVDGVALGDVFFKCFGFPWQLLFHQYSILFIYCLELVQ
jgi:hypothetical protein